MQHEHYDNSAYPSYTPGAGYPPLSSSSPHYHQGAAQRRWSAEYGQLRRPTSRAGGSRSPLHQPPRSPLSQAPSDEYEERDLAEMAAVNQAAQEQRWGPHTALSEAPHQTGGFGEYNRHNSMPVLPQYEAEPYDGGYYLNPPSMYAQGEFGAYTSPSPASIASSHTFGAGSRRSAPVYRSPSAQPSVAPPSSEPANMFNVNAAHHLPGGRGRPQDMFDPNDHPGAYPGQRMGDSLPGFPQWSRTWYNGHLSADGHAYTMVAPQSGQSGWESETLSHGRNSLQGRGPYGQYPYGRAGDPRMDDYVKEERIRMLEKEFGPKVSHKGKGKADDDDDDEEEEERPLVVGDVDDRGKLVLPGRKLRITTRCLQVIISLTTLALGVGGLLLLKPKDDPPPKGTAPSYALYAAAAISSIASIWLFALRPCCSSGRDGPDPGAGGNGMVIPVLGGGGGKKAKKGMPQGTTVNLIVDPALLGRGKDDDSDSDTLPGEGRRKRRKRPLGMLGNMKIQTAWKHARKGLKVTATWDCILCNIWIAAAVVLLGLGKKCSPGTFEGWCDVYNGALACTVIAAAVFGVAIFVDFRDLKATSRPPKARI